MMNLGKSLSVSELESDKYLLNFLKEEAMIVICFSLVLCSTTHHRVQLVLEISQGGNPFALAETGIHYKTLLSTQLTLSPRLLAPIKKGWELFCRCRLNSTFGRKNMQVLGHFLYWGSLFSFHFF